MTDSTLVRTFIAIDVPQSVKNEIQLVQNHLRNIQGARVTWARPEGIHLTLKFLGDVERNRITDVIEAVSGSARVSGELSLRTTISGGFPNLGKPRVLWIGVDGGNELISLQGAIDRELTDIGFPAEKKRFHPHLTVGRIKMLERNSMLPDKYGEYEFPAVEWTGEEILVMSSVLRPTGAEYSALGSCRLSL